MGLGYQAVNVKAPEFRVNANSGVANTVSSVILYTFAAAGRNDPIPEVFWGKYVRITAVGGDLHYLFTDKQGHAGVSAVIAATNAGAQDELLGGIVLSGTSHQCRIPTPPQGGAVYFSRGGSASGSARIELASD